MSSVACAIIQANYFIEGTTNCQIRETKLITEIRKSTEYRIGSKTLESNLWIQSAIEK